MGPTFRPIMFMADLTGMGLTSMKRPFISFRYFRWFSGSLPEVASYVRRTGTPLLSGTTGLSQTDHALLESLGAFAPVLWISSFRRWPVFPSRP